MKTYSVKPDDIKRDSHTVDATDKILGRLSTQIASLLMGKHKALFSRNADIGDSVTVINADKVRVTGNKAAQKLYYRHSNYPGGFRVTPYATMMQEHPERIITYSVDGMLPKNHLHDKMMNRLKVYAGPVPSKGKGKVAIAKPAVEKKVLKRSGIRNIAVKETKERREGKR